MEPGEKSGARIIAGDLTTHHISCGITPNSCVHTKILEAIYIPFCRYIVVKTTRLRHEKVNGYNLFPAARHWPRDHMTTVVEKLNFNWIILIPSVLDP